MKRYIILIAVVLGFVVQQLSAKVEERYEEIQIFAKVLNLVQQFYVEDVELKKLIYGGIKGMLQELDPHTNFMSPEIYKEFESETSGEFGGLGVELTVQDSVLTVISPIEDTPAWTAGIQAGDKIVEINGESTKGYSLVEAAQKMKGKKGEKIKLGVIRTGLERPKVYEITRGVVKIRSAKYTDLGEGYAYIRLTSFIENSYDGVKKFVESHIKANKGMKGMILDLRRNPGGLLDQAVKISDLFLKEGKIVTTMGRNEKEKEVLFAKAPGTFENFPIIVLIDEYSASASEIVSGALQDNGRALIMGRRSFGKGSVQSVVKLGDGSGLKLTVGRYYTPSGRSIQAEGIVPDVELQEVDPETFKKALIQRDIRREGDIKGHLLGEKEKEIEKKKNGKKSGTEFWWAKQDDKPENKNLTPKEKLMVSDFDLQQAYSYLKAIHILDGKVISADKPKSVVK